MAVVHSELTLRRQICDAGRVLYERGLIGPTDGNFSVRLGERFLLCTPSGAHKGELRPEEIVKLTVDGRVVSQGKPSSELKMHLAIYKMREDVRAIVHAHPPCAVGMTVAGLSLEQPVVPEILFAMGIVPNVPYSSPTTSDVPDAIRPILAKTDVFMMARHGSVVLCDTLREGVMKTEIIEHTAKITLAARVAGAASPLPAGEVNKLLGLIEMQRGSAVEPTSGYDGRVVRSPGAASRSAVNDSQDGLVDAITRAVLEKLRA